MEVTCTREGSSARFAGVGDVDSFGLERANRIVDRLTSLCRLTMLHGLTMLYVDHES
jgi:hypothetical protein